jgi:hypothetical protein
MNTIHGFVALVALVAVICRLFRMQRIPGAHTVTWNVWALAHASLGAGLVGIIVAAALRCQPTDHTLSALLAGILGIMLTHWRRRREDG